MNKYNFTSDMKVPTRPAPPPPTTTSNRSWALFDNNDVFQNKQQPPKKKAPPRPPPPKIAQTRTADKNSLVSGLFTRTQIRPTTESNLIDWNSPPSSPTRSSSDALSVRSFGSDSVTPSSGSTSNVESGFEDDFELYGAAPTRPPDPWSPPVQQPVPKLPAKPTWSQFSPVTSKKPGMPTIIRAKPERPKVPKVLEKKIEMDALAEVFQNARLSEMSSQVNVDYDDDGWSSDSPPMPTCPPPAPPPEVLAGLLEETLHTNCSSTTSARSSGNTAIALFDYQAQVAGDLNLKQGDRVEIIRRIDDHWVEASVGGRTGTAPTNHLQMDSADPNLVTALYAFNAEQWDDLSLEPGCRVRLLGRVSAEWLYGEVNGRRGQFPANFVDHIPADLPPWSSSSS